MRRLILHRQRALGAFALKYYCIVDRDRAAFLADCAGLESPPTQPSWDCPYLCNGDTISVSLDEGRHTVFVAAFLPKGPLATRELVVEAGDSDVYCSVLTDTNFTKGLGIALAAVPEGPV